MESDRKQIFAIAGRLIYNVTKKGDSEMKSDTRQNDYRQNLIDAGCDEKTIERFFYCTTKDEQLRILNVKRKQLLEDYRNDAKKLDCLDYLVNQLKKEGT